MNSSDISQFDQSSALMADLLSPLWRRMYLRLLEEGFTEDQALALLKVYVFALSSGKAIL